MPFPKTFKSFSDRKGGKSFSGGDFKKRGFSGGDWGDKEMHAAVCAKCNSRCEVPFKPNGRKPIYCSNCFVKDEGGASERGPRAERGGFGDRPSHGGNGDQYRDQLKEINNKLDAILRALEV